MSLVINQATTFANIPGFVPSGVLWYTEDTGDLYVGTGSSEGPAVTYVAGGTPGGTSGGDIYGVVAATQGNSPWIVAGVVSSTQGTSPWVTTATIQGAIPLAGIIGATQSGNWAVSGVVSATQGTSPWVVSGVLSTVSTVGAINALPAIVIAAGQAVTATIQGTIPVHAVTATIQGTVPVSLAAVSATQGTSPWIVAGVVSSTQGTSPWVTTATIQGAIALAGVVGTTQATSPWVTTATIQGAIPLAGVIGATQSGNWAVSGVVSSTQGTSPWVTTATIQGAIALAGVVGTTQSTSPWVTTATIQGTTPVSLAAVSATQGTAPWVIAGAVSATQGTSPWVTTATIQGAIALAGIVGTTQSTSPWVVAGVLGSTQGTTPWVAAATIQGTAAVQGILGGTQSGNWSVRNVGNVGGVFDALVTATNAPASGLATLLVATTNTVTSTLANGQSLAAQCDYLGNQFIRPYRRSQIKPAIFVALSTTSATTLFTAGATGVFRDISSLVITPIPSATTSFPTVVTLSDGTNSYPFSIQGGSAAATAGQAFAGTNIQMTFNPPLPQAFAATTWTVKQSVLTVTCNVVALAVESMIN